MVHWWIFRRRLSNRHGRPWMMLIWACEDRLGESLPYGSSVDFSRDFHGIGLLGIWLEKVFPFHQSTDDWVAVVRETAIIWTFFFQWRHAGCLPIFLHLPVCQWHVFVCLRHRSDYLTLWSWKTGMGTVSSWRHNSFSTLWKRNRRLVLWAFSCENSKLEAFFWCSKHFRAAAVNLRPFLLSMNAPRC